MEKEQGVKREVPSSKQITYFRPKEKHSLENKKFIRTHIC